MNARLLPFLLALLTRMSLAFRDPRPRVTVERMALGLFVRRGPQNHSQRLVLVESTL